MTRKILTLASTVLTCASLLAANNALAQCGPPIADGNIVITAPEGGSVISASGNYNCASGQTCDYTVSGQAVTDTFSVTPAPGYAFLGWRNEGAASLCQAAGSSCVVSLPAAWADDKPTRLLEPVLQYATAGPTLDEPFYMPAMTDTRTLDVVVLEDWHIDTIDGTTRQKLINIHVDDWWEGVEIRVPVRLIAPLQGSVDGFVITGSRLSDTGEGDKRLLADEAVAIEGGAGVVLTKIKGLRDGYPDLELPNVLALRNRFLETLDWRYTEFYLWGAIMMRAITAAFDDDLFRPGPVIAYGGSKNGMTPLIASIHDQRITAVRSGVAFAARTPIRANDPSAIDEVTAADDDFDAARADGLPQGDQPWKYYDKGYRSAASGADQALALGWSEVELQASLDRVADDFYVSENWEQLQARGVDILSLPGSHDWVAYDVPGTSIILPDLRTYIVPNGGHDRPGHPEAPSNSVDAAFFAEQLFGADAGLEIPDIATKVNGANLEVSVTFPDGGEPEDSRIFWMYDRRPDGSSWYLYELFPEANWAVMTGTGSTWTATIPLEIGRTTIDLITTHTVTADGNVIPISAPYTRVALD